MPAMPAWLHPRHGELKFSIITGQKAGFPDLRPGNSPVKLGLIVLGDGIPYALKPILHGYAEPFPALFAGRLDHKNSPLDGIGFPIQLHFRTLHCIFRMHGDGEMKRPTFPSSDVHSGAPFIFCITHWAEFKLMRYFSA